jgi:hypothetical protein
MHTGFWWVNVRKGDHVESQDIDRRITLKLMLKKQDGEKWPRLI